MNNLTKHFFSALTVVFFIFIAFGSGESDDTERIKREVKRKAENHRIAIISYAQVCVEKNLKSPSSAKFDMYDTKIWKIDDSTYMVKGPVDSQNGFGAMIRAYFECKIKLHDNDNFECLQVDIIE